MLKPDISHHILSFFALFVVAVVIPPFEQSSRSKQRLKRNQQPDKMLSIHELLNPATTPERPPALDFDISSAEASPTVVVVSNARATGNTNHPRFREWATAADPRQRGPVNFPPYEDLSDITYNEVRRFCVRPLGQIRRSYEHIPYNSSKKDFYSKTGREGIEGMKKASTGTSITETTLTRNDSI